MTDLTLQILLLICCVNNVLCKLSSRKEDWTYTTKAFTFNGEECVSDCENGQCVVNIRGEMRACYTTDELPFIFFTSRVLDNNSTECQSNCGFFGMEYQWCITKNGVIDYCNPSLVNPTERNIWNYNCDGACRYNDALKFYHCKIRGENLYSYCAPPALFQINSVKTQPDDSKTSVTEKPQNHLRDTEKPVTQTCEVPTEQPNKNQCNCDCKNHAEYIKKDIYFKIEANIPHEMVDKVQGNQYQFIINFDSKTPEKEKDSDRSTEKPASEGNHQHTDQTTETQNHLPYTKPDENVSEHPSTNNQGNEGSDELTADMMRSNFGKE